MPRHSSRYAYASRGKNVTRYDTRKHFFIERILNIWNSLPVYVVKSCSVMFSRIGYNEAARSSNQEPLYRAEITGNGSTASVFHNTVSAHYCNTPIIFIVKLMHLAWSESEKNKAESVGFSFTRIISSHLVRYRNSMPLASFIQIYANSNYSVCPKLPCYFLPASTA